MLSFNKTVLIATLMTLPVPIVLLPALAQTSPTQNQEARRLLDQGNEQFDRNQYEAAIQSWQRARMLYQQANDRLDEGKILGNLGLAYAALGQYPQAIEYQQQRLALARKINDRASEVKALGNLGNVYFALGNYPTAIEHQQQALAIARDQKNRLGEGNALGNLGNVYYALGEYPKAIEHHQQRLTIARELHDRLGEAQTLNNLGATYFALSDYPTAIEHCQQALILARQINDRSTEGSALGNLGNVFISVGNYPKAIEYQQQRLVITREIRDRSGEGQTLNNLGAIYFALKNYPKAIEYYQQRLAISRQFNDRSGESAVLGNLGNVYTALGEYPKAIAHHQQRLEIVRAQKDRLGLAQLLGSLGLIHFAQGEYPKAIVYHQQRLALSRELNDRLGEAQTLNNLGVIYANSKNFAQAETTLFAALQAWESLRPGLTDENKISLFETQAMSYDLLQQVLIAQNKPNPALEVAERGRSRAFVELLAQRLQPNRPNKTMQPPNLQQIQQIAKAQNATLVQYSTIEKEQLFIWVIQPTGEISFRQVHLQATLPPGTTLEEYVRTARSVALGVRGIGIVPDKPDAPFSPQQTATALQNLHRLLIAPIASLLPTNPTDRVIFIPQGALFLVPFPALQNPNGKYLIEQHTILTAPSIQVLNLTRQQQSARSPSRNPSTHSLIVGNPTMPIASLSLGEPLAPLPPLPGAEQEAMAIARFLNTTPLLGNQATKVRVKNQMPTATLIHLATHGLLDDQRGIGSAIALAPSDGNNGLLTAEEILDLQLTADLVVLSACDTGRGKITGDGVIGLSRSFISAGVPSVLVSLWAVPDAPTATLMTQFYQHWQQKPDKAQALRQAMLKTMQEHPQPRDWAAFTLIGEAE